MKKERNKGREKGRGKSRHLLFAALSLFSLVFCSPCPLFFILLPLRHVVVSSSCSCSSSSSLDLFETIHETFGEEGKEGEPFGRGDDKTIAGVKGE